METIFYDALKTIGDETKLKNWRRVHGGDINEAFYLRTEQGEYFLKFRKNCPGRFFACERAGLEALRESGAVHVPKVYGYKDGKDYGYILLEWIEGKKSDRLGEKLGRQLANLHRIPQEFFGFPEDNYIGILPQKNGRFASWIEYYREWRLLPQIRIWPKKRDCCRGTCGKSSMFCWRTSTATFPADARLPCCTGISGEGTGSAGRTGNLI
ncbi:Fructosamine-3-kinase [Caldibacillus debilis GB1]|uniref:Fructosamine-3-kinase n=1 Tax=Caldibacillus debilis GB1 TaxID=1339248 RepID=A0A420VFA0_9BACI|nr:Fructosamine-3-kinase [Caldibacillus debilis GB1]